MLEAGLRNSGHIQQFRAEAISLRAGRVSLYSLDSPHFHLSAYLFAYQGIPDPASCRAGLRRGGSVPEPTSSSSFFTVTYQAVSTAVSTRCGTSLRVRFFLKYVLRVAVVRRGLPYDVTGIRFRRVRGHRRFQGCKSPWSLRGSRRCAPHGSMGLMAGTAACCTTYIRCCPLVRVQSQPAELPATTVGESSSGGSL